MNGMEPERDPTAASDFDADPPAVQSRFGGYRLLTELGRGGQGVVWLAEDVRLGRKAALKLLSDTGPGAEIRIARFMREAALASKLDHPGICAVYEAGTERGVPFIAMRYVKGETLAARLGRRRPDAPTVPDFNLSFGDAQGPPSVAAGDAPAAENARSSTVDRAALARYVVVFEKIAGALHAAHEAGVVHRDVKPGNIMMTESDEPVVLDFGLARDERDDAGPTLTLTGDVFGTPAYMSPEQIAGRGGNVDRRTDVYSLGVTMFECFTRRRPFEAPTRQALYQAILTQEPPSARRLNPAISADLQTVLQCATEKDRDRRYQTAADLAEDLRRVREGEPVLAKKPSTLGRAWRWSKRRPAAAALAAVLVVGAPVVTGLAVWYWNHRDEVLKQERLHREEAIENALESGHFRLHEGDVAEAVADFETASTLDPSSAEASAALAWAHMARKDAAAALSALDRARLSPADAAASASTRAYVLRALGRTDEADALLKAAPKVDGALPWLLEGMLELERSDDELSVARKRAAGARAVENLSRAVAASPRARRAPYFLLARALGNTDDRATSAVVADALKALWPDAPQAWFWAGFARKVAHLERAEADLREAVRRNPKSRTFRSVLGLALYYGGRIDDAVEVFREATRVDPGSGVAHHGLGTALTAQSKYDEAAAAFREAARLEPRRASHRNELGNALRLQGRFVEAEEALREAVRLDPRRTYAHVGLGKVLLAVDRADEA